MNSKDLKISVILLLINILINFKLSYGVSSEYIIKRVKNNLIPDKVSTFNETYFFKEDGYKAVFEAKYTINPPKVRIEMKNLRTNEKDIFIFDGEIIWFLSDLGARKFSELSSKKGERGVKELLFLNFFSNDFELLEEKGIFKLLAEGKSITIDKKDLLPRNAKIGKDLLTYIYSKSWLIKIIARNENKDVNYIIKRSNPRSTNADNKLFEIIKAKADIGFTKKLLPLSVDDSKNPVITASAGPRAVEEDNTVKSNRKDYESIRTMENFYISEDEIGRFLKEGGLKGSK